jgi:hypothetical protein
MHLLQCKHLLVSEDRPGMSGTACHCHNCSAGTPGQGKEAAPVASEEVAAEETEVWEVETGVWEAETEVSEVETEVWVVETVAGV